MTERGLRFQWAMIRALHERHAAPPGFDSRAEDCDTCKEDAAIAVRVANSPDALLPAIGVVYTEGEKVLPRDDWKELGRLLTLVDRGAAQ